MADVDVRQTAVGRIITDSQLEREAEYQAAKEAYIKAQVRLSTAKAAMKPIWAARKKAQHQAYLAMLVKAAEAFVAGVPTKQVAVIGGRSASYSSMSDLLGPLWREVLSHDEIYSADADYTDHPHWELKVTAKALARYRERTAA